MAYSDSFPATRPVFQSDFANGGRIDPRISYSRSTTGSFYGKDKHLSSENLLTYSSQFTNGWTGDHITLNSTPVTGPDGVSSNAYEITENSSPSTQFRIYQDITNIDGGAVTVYAKLGDSSLAARKLTIKVLVATNNLVVGIYDLSTGTASLHTGSASTYTGVSVSQTASGNGFYKCVLTVGTGTIGLAEFGLSDGTTPNQYGLVWYSGNNTSSIILSQASVSTTGASDYNGTSTQIHREYAPTLQTAAINAPRFEYSASDSASMGLLVEGSVANVMPYSRNGFNASNAFQYTLQSGVTATESAAVGPSGSLDATLIAEDSSTGGHQFQTTETVTSAAHTVSVYVKPVGVPSFGIRITSGSVYGSVFTFADESFTNYGTAPETSRIEPVGNGWYRLSISQTVTSGSSLIRFNLFDAGGSASYVGNGFNGILVWGFQCEANAFPSSWIDTGTSGSTATRAADSAAVATSSFYTGGPFTIVSETEGGYGWYPMAWTLSDESNSNRVYVYRNHYSASDSTNWYLESRSDGVSVVSAFISSSASAGKLAVSYGTNDVSFCASGGTVTTDTAASLPASASELQIGAHWDSTNQLNGHIKRIALYGEALSDTNLQALTS